MKYSLLAAVTSTAFIVSGALAGAQENAKHETQPGAARSEARPGEPNKAEPREAPRAAQMNQDQKAETGAKQEHRPAQTQDREKQPAQAENPTSKQSAGPDGAKEKQPNQLAQSEDKQPNQRSTEQLQQRPQTRTGEAEEKQEQHNRTGAAEGSGGQTRSGAAEERNTSGRKGAAENRGQPRVVGKVQTSSEHATRISDMLMRGGRRENVDININVGARIPDSVTVYPLPPEVIAIAPEYRGYDYFVENDEVVFVAPETHEIVGSIAYEGRAAAAEGTRVAGARPCPIEN